MYRKVEEAVGIETNGLQLSDIPVLPFRQLRQTDSELAENEPGECAEDKAAEAIKDACVILLRLLRMHDVDGLRLSRAGTLNLDLVCSGETPY